jgi:hypothetical protein
MGKSTISLEQILYVSEKGNIFTTQHILILRQHGIVQRDGNQTICRGKSPTGYFQAEQKSRLQRLINYLLTSN